MKKSPSESWIGPVEASAVLGINRRKLYQWVAEGALIPNKDFVIRDNGRRLYRKKAILSLREQMKSTAVITWSKP